MKRFAKLLSLILCAALLASLTACMQPSDEEIPEGMQLATAAGDDFRLYIPTNWTPNTMYGISGGYATLSTQSTVSMVKYPISEDLQAALDAQATAENAAESRIDYFHSTQCLPDLKALCLGGSFSEVAAPTADLIHRLNARRYHYTGIANETELQFLQVITEREGAFYVFSYIAEKTFFDRLLPDVETMLDVLVFSTPYEPSEYVKPLDADVTAPAGMKLASNDEVAYRFFVPESWAVNRDERIFAAYVAEDRSSVSVVPYMPEGENMSIAEFYTQSSKRLIEVVGEENFRQLSDPVTEGVTLGGRVAYRYHYSCTIGGTEYHYLQVIAAYKSMLYSVTYTARPEHFDAHLDDVNAIIGAFQFR